MNNKISEKTKELKNTYAREWRKKNKDKVKAATQRYWERKAAAALSRESDNGAV